eukprot:1298313-Prymnesium_polylepis.1
MLSPPPSQKAVPCISAEDVAPDDHERRVVKDRLERREVEPHERHDVAHRLVRRLPPPSAP